MTQSLGHNRYVRLTAEPSWRCMEASCRTRAHHEQIGTHLIRCGTGGVTQAKFLAVRSGDGRDRPCDRHRGLNINRVIDACLPFFYLASRNRRNRSVTAIANCCLETSFSRSVLEWSRVAGWRLSPGEPSRQPPKGDTDQPCSVDLVLFSRFRLAAADCHRFVVALTRTSVMDSHDVDDLVARRAREMSEPPPNYTIGMLIG